MTLYLHRFLFLFFIPVPLLCLSCRRLDTGARRCRCSSGWTVWRCACSRCTCRSTGQTLPTSTRGAPTSRTSTLVRETERDKSSFAYPTLSCHTMSCHVMSLSFFFFFCLILSCVLLAISFFCVSMFCLVLSHHPVMSRPIYLVLRVWQWSTSGQENTGRQFTTRSWWRIWTGSGVAGSRRPTSGAARRNEATTSSFGATRCTRRRQHGTVSRGGTGIC